MVKRLHAPLPGDVSSSNTLSVIYVSAVLSVWHIVGHTHLAHTNLNGRMPIDQKHYSNPIWLLMSFKRLGLGQSPKARTICYVDKTLS